MTLHAFLEEWHNPSPTVLVHTSGSTGKPKPLLVEKRRMEVSAEMTCSTLGLKEGDVALLCMPLDYIAGKMMVVRALKWGLKLFSVLPSGHPLADWPEDVVIDFAAMIPMQVYNSLQVPKERECLMSIKHLIIGGGAIDSELERQLQYFPNNVYSSYGMTETLSHIALRRLNGPSADEWYKPLDGVRVWTDSDDDCLVIDAPLLNEKILKTNDIAMMRSDGCFRILGRKDNVICSGGIKIQIEEVEGVLSSFLIKPFMVTKVKDEKFGDVVTLLTEDNDIRALIDLCQKHLPKYWQPKHFFHVPLLPHTETGKAARKRAEEIAEKLCSEFTCVQHFSE